MTVKEWYDLLSQIGCIVCLKHHFTSSPPEMHHILRSGRKIDDLHTIPLCYSHHRSEINIKLFVSRHPWKKEFERRYGTELELLEETRRIVKEHLVTSGQTVS